MKSLRYAFWDGARMRMSGAMLEWIRDVGVDATADEIEIIQVDADFSSSLEYCKRG